MDQTTTTIDAQPFVYLHYLTMPDALDREIVAIAFDKCNFIAYRTVFTAEMRPVRDA